MRSSSNQRGRPARGIVLGIGFATLRSEPTSVTIVVRHGRTSEGLADGGGGFSRKAVTGTEGFRIER